MVDSMSTAAKPAFGMHTTKMQHLPRQASSTNMACSTTTSASEWVWGQGQYEAVTVAHGVVKTGKIDAAQHGGNADDSYVAAATNKSSSDIRSKMLSNVASPSFESTCSTEALTDSATNSPKDYNFDDPFLNRLSDMSLRFPEPPTGPPAAIRPSSSRAASSRALTISGFSKNISINLPSVQLPLPLWWRKRLRSAVSNKRCRKSTTRWIARSKATSSMSEKSLLIRALSMNDKSRHQRCKGMESVVENVSSAPPQKSALAPLQRELSELSEGKPPQLAKVPEQQQQQRPQHLDRTHSSFSPPSGLPTPLPFLALQTPPPAPLHTAPRPPVSSRQQKKQQVYNMALLLASRRSSRHRRPSFASTPTVASAKENRYPSSPAPRPPPRMTVKNRLASSSSSIFEEDGDHSKRTLFLDPYSTSPLPAATTAAAPAAACAAAAAATTATANAVGKKYPLSSSDSWLWGGKSTSPSTSIVATQHQQQQQAMFAVGADDAEMKMKKKLAVRALQIEAIRKYGDRRRRIKNGESGIWLPSPGIWSSARRPTPLNSDHFSPW